MLRLDYKFDQTWLKVQKNDHSADEKSRRGCDGYSEELGKREVGQSLVSWLEEKAATIGGALVKLTEADDQRCDDLVAKAALPPAEDLDKIMRYERHLQMRMDWILRELRNCKHQRRAK